jgi:hypothetical protein
MRQSIDGRRWSMRGGNLLSDLSILAPNAAADGVQGAGGLPLGPPAGAARRPGLETAVGSAGMVCRPTCWDGAPRGWPSIPMAWASARGIASTCRWPLRRGSSTRVGGGTSVAPPLQERPTQPGCYDAPPDLAGLDALGCDAVHGHDVSRPCPGTSSLAPAAAGGNGRVAVPAMNAGSPAAPATQAAWPSPAVPRPGRPSAPEGPCAYTYKLRGAAHGPLGIRQGQQRAPAPGRGLACGC